MSKIHEVKTLPGLSRAQWEWAKPILFNSEMVRAIKEDRKRATRRVVKLPKWAQLTNQGTSVFFNTNLDGGETEAREFIEAFLKPPCRPGDILYVRETWCNINRPGFEPDYYYFADMKYEEDYDPSEWKWRPSIHMPKEAARLFLRVTDVRVERLQDILNDPPGPNNQVVREGCAYGCDFIALWDSTIKPADRTLYGWDANPLVWVIEFERISKEEALERTRGGDGT